MSPRSSGRIVTIVFLIALEILTIKSNVNAFVINQDPNKLEGALREVEDVNDEIKFNTKKDSIKIIDIKHDGTSHKIVPIETTAKTEEIQKNTLVTSSTNEPQHVTISESNYIDGHTITEAHDYPSARTPVDFLLDNLETTSTESSRETSTLLTERNNTTSYSTEAVQTEANTRSDESSTINFDDDRQENTWNANEFMQSTTTITTPQAQKEETTVISTESEISLDMSTTLKYTSDTKPVHWKKYTTIDRKRSNINMDAETLNTTDKEVKLATAETRHQNTETNGNFISLPNWSFVSHLPISKQEISSNTETVPSASSQSSEMTHLSNKITQELHLTNEATTDNSKSFYLPSGMSSLFELSKQEITSSTETSLLVTSVSQKNSSLKNSINQPTEESHPTSNAVTDTSTSTTSTNLMSTTEGSKNLTSTIEAKTDQLSSTSDLSSSRAPRAYSITEAANTADSSRSTNKINSETTKGVLTSRRAGYLDMSSKPTSRMAATTADGRTTRPAGSGESNKTSPVAEPGPATDRKVYYMQSQSQLAEDAINEELMKEEMMNDHIGHTQKTREQRKDKVNDATEKAPVTINSDDILSVKPIGVDKQKNSGLYTVSPNYKPLKKIEVQPPKQFVRDPDDNSWRNESLSSLGIVFKANNSTKPLTQVLKNKTETELNSFLEKYGKSDEPELRTRLEKIAEQRKTKKRVGEKFGETGYGDSEETLNFFVESSSLSTPEVKTVDNVPSVSPIPKLSAAIFSSTTEEPDNFVKSTIFIRPRPNGFLTTTATKKYNYESFDGSEEEPDYSSLSNIDIKKNPVKKNKVASTSEGPKQSPFLSERTATVQYFPPRPKAEVNINDYDYSFKRKVQALQQDSQRVSPLVYSSSPTTPPKQISHSTREHKLNDFKPMATDVPLHPLKTIITQRPENPQFEGQDGFNGASYVIKHLRDFIHLAARESEEDQPAYLTEPPRAPIRGATAHTFLKDNTVKTSDYDDYESQSQKDVLHRFVENFNQNSERFKVDFPVLYNTSIIHSNFADTSQQASSSAFMKRLHETPRVSRTGGAEGPGGEAGCERAVELAPEYELHYYVPEQEEREVAHSDQVLSPVRYQLSL